LTLHIALTGATGFVGSHVLDHLIDRYAPQARISVLTRDAEQLHRRDGVVNVVVGDIHDSKTSFFNALGRPDVLMHLAWAGLPNYNQSFHFESELPLQYAFLKRMVQDGLKKLVVTGTCFEYGAQTGGVSVNTACLDAMNCYAFSKRALHQQLLFLQQECQFDLLWMRLFYMYGDRQRHGSLFTLLKAAVDRGDLLFPMSAGEQLRDYLKVEQVAEKLVAAAMTKEQSGTHNVCSGQPLSIRRLVEIWCKDNGWKINLDLGAKPYLPNESMAFWGV
jgi:nucleoside-diphosphate-sugar epimerase